MTQDFAKKQSPAMTGNRQGLPGWVWFITGLALGIFSSFIYYLWRDVPHDPAADDLVGKPTAEIPSNRVEEMTWDFYDIFPKSEVPIVEEYQPDGTKVTVKEPTAYLLQAGSFRSLEDADRLRAELILQGLNAFTREIEKDGEAWHRVLVGPIDSEIEMNRQKRRLAEANIASIPLRVTQ